MYNVCILLWLAATSVVYGQNIEFTGKLVDSETQAPVVFANISFLNSNKGVSTNTDGTFVLTIDKKDLEASIHISSLNYHDTIIKALQLHNKVLQMKGKIEELDVVELTGEATQSVTLDVPKKQIFSLHSTALRMIAKYFPNTKYNRCCDVIDKVTIHFPKRKNEKAIFRFRIFDRDNSTGLPKNDLLKESIPLTINDTTEKIALELSQYNIKVPKDGFFIAFEKLLIPYNAYKKGNDFGTLYAPILGWSKSQKFSNYSRNFLFVKGKWIDMAKLNTGKAKGYVPAISVTLIN